VTATLDETAFTAADYDLNVLAYDGRKATELDIRFSGSGKLDSTSEDDLALLEAARLGAPVRLIVTGTVNAHSFQLTGTDGDELAFAVTVKVDYVEAGELA
jgi:hypothetical protein